MAYNVTNIKITSGSGINISDNFNTEYTSTPAPYGTITITPLNGFTVEDDLPIKVVVTYTSDETNCDPKQFDYIIPGSGGGGGSISVEPASRSWTYNETGSTNSKSFTITKSGDATVHPSRVILTGTNSSKFHIADVSESSCTVYPVETNTTTGDYNAIVVIPYSVGGVDQTPKQVNLIQYKNGGGEYEYVEIGGLKWATKNIGANSITDGGLYFQWADTQGYTASEVGNKSSGKKYFWWSDYKYCDGTSTNINKYNATDNLTTITSDDDAATVNIGAGWRIPTNTDFQSLKNAIDFIDFNGNVITEDNKIITLDGIKGIYVADKNDHSKRLFFPAAGRASSNNVELTDGYGYYWSSSLGTDIPYSVGVNFDSIDVRWNNNYSRCYGFLIRPVKE